MLKRKLKLAENYRPAFYQHFPKYSDEYRKKITDYIFENLSPFQCGYRKG